MNDTVPPAGTPPAERRAMFGTVLVANRGEIACRILTTLARLDIRSVAVFSDADRGARHVALADTAVRIGPAAPQASYLDIDAIIAAAKQTGAEAIHPGYGFLSENAALARACETAGIVFVGPSVSALGVMGDKIRSKNHVAGYGVPVIPGISEPGLSDEELVAAAAGVGYPLLIKPSAGGGGKGMQLVNAPGELASGLVAARRVAASAFADDTLLLERFVTAPRHIEVQVLADRYGAIIHLGERECSLQRRHQKVIEEAPSPLLDAETRARIGDAACRVARSVDYTGAGTVEFLVSDAAPSEFFFMEMNTRLQVEHPVTELVTGIDLVEWQLRVAAGQPLVLRQEDVRLDGHAVEARVYAENPERGFLPTAGTVLLLDEPAGEGVRIDSSLVQGLEIGSHYDPMLSKIVAWGESRAQALARLDGALADTVVLGLHTNLEYLRGLVADPEVAAGRLDTGLIDRRLPTIRFRAIDHGLLASAAVYLHSERWAAPDEAAGRGVTWPGRVWTAPSGWRMAEPRPSRYSLAVSATETVDVLVQGTADAAFVSVGAARPGSASESATTHAVSLVPVAGAESRFSIAVDGVATVWSIVGNGRELWLGADGFVALLTVRTRSERLAEHLAANARADRPGSPEVRSPMPGTVVAVQVADGDVVEAGQTLLTVEAMKMEHRLTASVSGVVSIHLRPGELVKLDQIVATIANQNPEHQGGQP
ncbi:ATP-binding protein [Luethyella okanaganae]|uniref:biotin carboxylase n=1 Tax=Luethyella okanaganae TaxID=69372 RepID=A0ABW1VJP4_9MICO